MISLKCRSWTILALPLLLFFLSCQRSPQFFREDEFGRSDSPGYYSGRPEEGQRIESIGQPKKTAQVLDFWNDTPVTQEALGEFVAEEIKRGLSLSQRVMISNDIHTHLATENFVQGSQVKVAQLIREGQRIGVAVLVVGRIAQITFRQKGDDIGLFRQKQSLAAVTLETKLFDVQGGREILTVSKVGEASHNAFLIFEGSQVDSPSYRAELTQQAGKEAVGQLLPDLVKAVEKLTWQGRVAKIIGPKVYINAGKAAGLRVGDILRVLSIGDEIFDPISGAYLGRAQGQLKGTLEVVDFIGPDGGVSGVHTGGNFREGDLVQLY